MFLPRKDNRETRARARKGMGLAVATVLVAGFTGLSGAASGSAARLGPRSPVPAGAARLYAASAGATRAEAPSKGPAGRAPMDRRVPGDVTMPSRPALCSVGAIYGPDPLGAKDGGCLVDWYFGPTTPPEKVVRADGFLSLSVPSVIRLGVPFTISVHAPYPACPLAKEQPKTCVEQWDTDLRAVDSVTSTQSDPAGVPLTMKATSTSNDQACGGSDIGIPGAVVGNRALTCQVEIVSLQPGFNPDGQWWALGGGVEDFSSMQGEIEVPVEIVGPGCAGAPPTSSSDSQGAKLTPDRVPVALQGVVEVVPLVVDLEVAVPRSRPAVW